MSIISNVLQTVVVKYIGLLTSISCLDHILCILIEPLHLYLKKVKYINDTNVLSSRQTENITSDPLPSVL